MLTLDERAPKPREIDGQRIGRRIHRQNGSTTCFKVKYRDDGIIVVDIIVYRGRGFKEPWFLIVPAGSEEQLPTERVVQWC